MDNKALVVTLVAVFVVGLVLGSASFGGLSGRAVSGNARVQVSPATVGAGQSVNIYFDPRGSDCMAFIYRVNDAGIESRIDLFEYTRGQGRACTQSTNYRYSVPLSYNGQYCVRVYPSQALQGSSQFVQDCFTVI